MRSAILTNVLLAAIAAGIFLSLVLDRGAIGSGRYGDGQESGAGPYRVLAVGMSRELLLLDTQTGRMWRSPFKSSRWIPMEAPPGSPTAQPDDTSAGADPEGAPEAGNP